MKIQKKYSENLLNIIFFISKKNATHFRQGERLRKEEKRLDRHTGLGKE